MSYCLGPKLLLNTVLARVLNNYLSATVGMETKPEVTETDQTAVTIIMSHDHTCHHHVLIPVK